MRNPYLIILLFVVTIGYSQSHGISYQAVLLNPKGEELPGQNNTYLPLLDQKVCLRFEIKNTSNELEYQETFSTKTDAFGMVNLIIGTGNQTGGKAVNFDALQWNTIPKKLVVSMDTKGNCNSFIEISSQDFAGVPFAFSAQNAENVIGIVPVTNGGTGATTAATARKNLGLENLNNTSDTNKPVSIATQTALDLKENMSNKSNNIIADANSTSKYPSVKIIKEYVDAIVSAGVPDATSNTIGKIQLTGDLSGTANSPEVATGAISTAKIANDAITDAKVANGISPSKVGLGNVDNTSDVNKPISTATQSALDLKANLASPTFTGTVSGIDKTMVGLENVDNISDAAKPISTATQSALDLKAPLASPTFTGTVAGITKTMVGLGNVDDTTDINKPVSTATQTALDLKAPLASPTFTGTVAGITKTMVGLGNVDDTTDLNKPISTATQTALDLKQNVLTNPVTGIGTLNSVPKFSGTTTLGNSNISDNGTLVSITTNATVNGLSLGRGPGNFDSNSVLGLNSLASNTTGINNTAFGLQALLNNTIGNSNTALGRDALYSNIGGSNNVAIGKSAMLYNTSGSSNISIGLDSELNNTTGNDNVAVGQSALRLNTIGSQNTAVGRGALGATIAGANTALGFAALSTNTSGSDNVAIGWNAGRFDSSGTNPITSTGFSVYLGSNTKGLNTSGSTNEVVIGNSAVGLGSNSTVLGNSATTKAAIYGNLLLGTTTDDGFKLNVNGTGRVTGQLSLGSTITNGTNTYTLPSATGTFALTSQIPTLSGTLNYISKFTGTGSVGNSLIFDNGSNVGIGTNAPEVPLHIVNNSTSHILRLESNSTDGTTLMLKNNSTGGSFWRIYSSGSGNGEGAGHLFLNNSIGVPVVFRSNGNVLIGTPTDIGAKLNVNGTGRFSGQLSLGSTITNGTNTFTLPSSTGTFALTSDLGSYLPLTGGSLTGALVAKNATFIGTLGGTVGINNPSPIYPLDVFSNTQWTANAIYARFGNGSSTAPSNPYRWIELGRYGADNGAVGYIQGESDNQIYKAFAINPRGGNVLIGTASDTGVKLKVNGSYANASSNNEGSDSSIDFSLSNIAYTATTSAAIVIDNIKDGGIYYLAITATTVSDPVAFTATGFTTIKYLGNMTRAIGKTHMYRFIVAGTTVFVSVEKEN